MRLYLSFEAKQEEQPRCFLFGHVITSAFRLLQAAFPTISVSLFVTEENDGVKFNSVNTEREKHQKKTEEKEEIIII